MIDFENIKQAPNFGLRGETVFASPNCQQLAEIASLLETGAIKPHISELFPLQEAEKAHRLIQSGRTRGKIILAIR